MYVCMYVCMYASMTCGWMPGSKEEPYLEVKSCLLAARWHKLVFNLVFSGIGVAMGGVAVDVVVRDPALVEIANRVITNTVYVANIDIQAHVQAAQGASKEMNDSSAVTDTSAAGLGVADTYTASNACESGGSYPHLLDCEAVRAEVWRKSKGSGPYRTSAVIDLLEGRQLEMHSLFLAPIQVTNATAVGGEGGGVGWSGMGWSGVGWDGVGWDGVGWDGVGWVGVG